MPFLRCALKLDGQAKAWSEQCDIPDGLLDNPKVMMSEVSLYAFSDMAALRLDVPDLNLLVAEESQISDLGGFGALLQQSLTLHHLLLTFVESLHEVSTGAAFWVVPDGAQVGFCRRGTPEMSDQCRALYGHVTSDDGGERQAELFVYGLMVQLVRLVADDDWVPDVVHLRNPNPCDSGLVSRLGQTDMLSAQPFTAIQFPAAWLPRPLPEPVLSPRLRALRAYLDTVPHAVPDLDEAAEFSGVPRRSLQRALSTHGLTYRRLVEQVRFAAACRGVHRSNTTLRDVAMDLGYSDPTSFTRAMRRWSGMSPQAYRRWSREPYA